MAAHRMHSTEPDKLLHNNLYIPCIFVALLYYKLRISLFTNTISTLQYGVNLHDLA